MDTENEVTDGIRSKNYTRFLERLKPEELRERLPYEERCIEDEATFYEWTGYSEEYLESLKEERLTELWMGYLIQLSSLELVAMIASANPTGMDDSGFEDWIREGKG